MTFVKNLYADMIDKRLWPLALVLLVALIAVPVVLSKEAEKSTVEPTPPTEVLGGGASSLLGETKPVVSLEGAGSFRRHVGHLSRKNPFTQQARGSAPATSQSSTPPGGTGAVPTTGSTATPPAVSVPPTTTQPPTTQPKQFNYTATVKFGEIGKTEKKKLSPTDALPNTDDPVLVFMGASSGGKEAVFVVSSTATARGDGECKPSELKCNFLRLKAGDVEFLEVAGENDTVTTYQLDLIKLGATVASKAHASSSKHEVGPKRHGARAHSARAKHNRHALTAKTARKIFKALTLIGF
jgi:hypothetical protein